MCVNSIGWNVATTEWEVYDLKIEVICCVMQFGSDPVLIIKYSVRYYM